MKYQVVTVTDHWDNAPYYFHSAWMESLRRHGDEPKIIGFGEPWSGLLTKPRRLKQWIESGGPDSNCLIVVDSYDLIFRSSPQEIVDVWESIDCPFIIGAERALFPNDLNEKSFPKSASSYRFPNSGFIISTTWELLSVLKAMDLENLPDDHQLPDGRMFHGNDQLEYQRVFLKQPVPMHLDTRCRFVWNLCGVDMSNMSFRDDGLILNQETDTFPMVFHFNGGSKEGPVKDAIFKHLKF